MPNDLHNDHNSAALTLAESMSLDHYRQQWQLQQNLINTLATTLLGLVGVQCLREFMPSALSAEAQATETELSFESSGLILFEHLDPLYIKAIVEQVHAVQDPVFQSLQISITHKALQGLDLGSVPPAWVVPDNQNATYWRNNIDSGTMVLSAISSGENEDTLSNITRRISSTSLKQQLANEESLPELLVILGKAISLLLAPRTAPAPNQVQGPFHGSIPSSLQGYLQGMPRAITRWYKDQLRADLTTTLGALLDLEMLTASPLQLCAYVSSVLLYLAQDDKLTLRQALGLSLPIFEVPREQELFSFKGKSKALSKNNVTKLLNNTLKERPTRFKYVVAGQELDSFAPKLLAKNLKALLNATVTLEGEQLSAGTTVSSNQSPAQEQAQPLLSEWEAGLLTEFVSVRASAKREALFPELCNIDWQGKLELLFSTEQQQTKKKSLYERTMEMFTNHLTNEAKLSAPEEDIIGLVKQNIKSLSSADRLELNDLYQKRRAIFVQEPAINREWLKYIYYEDTFADSNFLLSLSKAILNLACTADSDEVLERITITLDTVDGTAQQILNKNYAVMSYFSLRYGAFLRDLTQKLPGRLVVDYVGSATTSQALSADVTLNPLFNFPQFFAERLKSTQKGTKSRAGSTSSKKQDVTLTFVLKASYRPKNQKSSGRGIGSAKATSHTLRKIVWQLQPECVSAMMSADLQALVAGPSLRFGFFAHNDATDQGTIQNLSLYNNTTLILPKTEAEQLTFFSQQGSEQCDLTACWQQTLHVLTERYPHEQSAISALEARFTDFAQRYQHCLESLQACTASYAEITALNVSYEALQYELLASPLQQDNLLKELLALTLQVGMAYRQDAKSVDDCSAIATPFTVEALRSHACKLKRVSELICTIFTQPLHINERKVFLASLEQDLNYYDAPELCLYGDHQHELIATQGLGGYTLYAAPQKIKRDLQQNLASTTDTTIGRKKVSASEVSIGAQGGGGCAGIGGTNARADASAVDLEALGAQLDDYLVTNPYPLSQCTLVLSHCPAPSFALELYRLLKHKQDASVSLRQTRFNLVIVCDDMEVAQSIFAPLESERLTLKQTQEGAAFVKDVSVTIVRDNPSAANFGSLNGYLERMCLQQSTAMGDSAASGFGSNTGFSAVSRFSANFGSNFSSTYGMGSGMGMGRSAALAGVAGVAGANKANERFAQIGLMVHVFDSHANFSFTEPYQVPLVTDEVQYQPSLVSMVDNHHSLGSETMSRFVVIPVLPLSKILWQHSIYLLLKDGKAWAQAKEQLRQSLAQPTKAATIATPLYVRTLVMDYASEPLKRAVQNIHQTCDTVFYLDDLLDRSHLTKQLGVRVLYYHKLPQNSLNFIIATQVNVEAKTRQFLQELVAQTIPAEQQAECFQELTAASLQISGRLLMQAQQRRKQAYELMGVVLTAFVGQCMMATIAQKYPLSTETYRSFVYLDNYKALFTEVGSKRHKCLSDLLGLQVLKVQEQDETRYLINLLVLESKFAQNASKDTSNKSLLQTRETTELLYRAFKDYNTHYSLDRQQWLARIADMLVDNRDHKQQATTERALWGSDHELELEEFSKLQQLIRDGQVDILLKGCSIVFDRAVKSDADAISGASSAPRCSANIAAGQDKLSVDQGFPLLQIKFTGAGVSDVLQCFHKYHGYGQAAALQELSPHDDLISSYCLKDDARFLLKAQLSVTDATAAAEFELEPEVEPASVPAFKQVGGGSGLVREMRGSGEPSIQTVTTKRPVAKAQRVTAPAPAAQHRPQPAHTAVAPAPWQAQAPQIQTMATPQATTPSTASPAASMAPAPVPKTAQPQATWQRMPKPQQAPTLPQQSVLSTAPQAVMPVTPATAPLPPHPTTPSAATTAAALTQAQWQGAATLEPATAPVSVPELVPAPEQVLAPERSIWLATLPRRAYDAWRPDVATLLPYIPRDDAAERDLLVQRATQINNVLREFGSKSTVLRAELGPVITRFILKLAYGESSKNIERIVAEMPRKLQVKSVRFDAQSGSLEVPNEHRSTIALGEVLTSPEFMQSKAELPLALGLTPEGSPVVCDLVEGGPHLLVAGTTGSGKSVGLNCILLSLITLRTPQELRLIIIDPKREFTAYDALPHMLLPAINDVIAGACTTLDWCIAEMERRFELFHSVGQNSLWEYNQYVTKARACGAPESNYLALKDHGHEFLEPLPRIVVMIDEFSDLMAQTRAAGRTKGSEFESLLSRLAAKCRAAGIHLILATQSPRKEVVTGLIKGNLKARIAFSVSSSTESRIILDETGAETLLGKGDMLYHLNGDTTHRAHGAYVSSNEIRALVKAWHTRYGDPEYLSALATSLGFSVSSTGSADVSPALQAKAVDFVQNLKKQGVTINENALRYGLDLDKLTAAKLLSKLQEQGLA